MPGGSLYRMRREFNMVLGYARGYLADIVRWLRAFLLMVVLGHILVDSGNGTKRAPTKMPIYL